MNGKFYNMLGRISSGESILIEYSPVDHSELVFYTIINWAKSRELPILIYDILDTLHIFTEHLKFHGTNTGFVKDVPVIKCGGSIEAGNVLRRIKLHEDIIIYSKEVSEATTKFISSAEKLPVIVIVLGIEKMLRIYESEGTAIEYFFEAVVRKLLGHPKRTAFLFGIPDRIHPITRAELRETATRVLRIEDYGRKVKIMKSPLIEETGKEVVL